MINDTFTITIKPIAISSIVATTAVLAVITVTTTCIVAVESFAATEKNFLRMKVVAGINLLEIRITRLHFVQPYYNRLDAKQGFSFSAPSYVYEYQNIACFYIH